MSKKDYIKDVMWANFVDDFMSILESDNGRFDKERFLEACGMNSQQS